MASPSRNANAAQDSADFDELGANEGGIVTKYIFFAMALLILAAIALIFLRFVLYLW